jgi:hypothetical protein
MKYVNIRIPEPMPFGETSFEARVRAIVAALLVNNPEGGCVESVFTLATHRFVFFGGMTSYCFALVSFDLVMLEILDRFLVLLSGMS